MGANETKLVDATGDCMVVARDGNPVADPEWDSCRLVLTTDRLMLVTGDGKRSVSFGDIELLDAEGLPQDAIPEDVDAAGTTPVRIDGDVLLVDTPNVADLEREYYRATVQTAVILAKDEAVVEGAPRDTAEWSKARFRFDDGTVSLEFPDGDRTEFRMADVEAVETDEREIMGSDRLVTEVERVDAGDRVVETHLSGTHRDADALAGLFDRALAAEDADDGELSPLEREILMALYSGVSPFEMADFVGITVDEVEDAYERLLAVGAVDEVRTRTEVELTDEGRNIASSAMTE